MFLYCFLFELDSLWTVPGATDAMFGFIDSRVQEEDMSANAAAKEYLKTFPEMAEKVSVKAMLHKYGRLRESGFVLGGTGRLESAGRSPPT